MVTSTSTLLQCCRYSQLSTIVGLLQPALRYSLVTTAGDPTTAWSLQPTAGLPQQPALHYSGAVTVNTPTGNTGAGNNNNNNNNRRLVTLAEHTSDHGRQTNSSTEEKGEQV